MKCLKSSKERRMVEKNREQPCESEEGKYGVEEEGEQKERARGGGGGETTGQTQPVCVSTSLHRIDSHEEDRGKSERRGRAGEMENN